MNGTPTADTQSPWYEPFAPDQDSPDTPWLPGTEFPTRTAAARRKAEATEENWATDALFECYNG
jgi:hypothetical protein